MTLNSKSFSEKQIHLSGLGSFYILSFCMIALFFSACGSYSHDKHYKKNKNFGLETEDTAGDSESEEDPNGVDVTPETSEKPPVGPGMTKINQFPQIRAKMIQAQLTMMTFRHLQLKILETRMRTVITNHARTN